MLKPTLSAALLALTLLALSCGQDSNAPRHEVLELLFTPIEESRANDIADAILEEQTTTDVPAWAGSYSCGNGLSENVSLSLAPRAGFVFLGSGCLGIYDRNYGQAESSGRSIHLICELPQSKDHRRVATEFIHVPWGERNYLITPDQMMEFIEDVNTGEEPRRGVWGQYLMRDTGREEPPTGQPEIPETWRGALLR